MSPYLATALKFLRIISTIDYQYIGVSLDGIKDTHDQFRRVKGSFDEALRGVHLLYEFGTLELWRTRQ